MKVYCLFLRLTEFLWILHLGNDTGTMNPQVDTPTIWFPQLIGTKVPFSKVRHVDIAYCRMLLNDTMLMKDSFLSGTSDTPCVTVVKAKRICRTLFAGLWKLWEREEGYDGDCNGFCWYKKCQAKCENHRRIVTDTSKLQ